MTNNKAATTYLRKVKRQLACSAQSREALCSRAQDLVFAFAEENPEATYHAYLAAFGEPQAFAEEALSVLDEDEVETAKRTRKRRRITVVIACGVLAVAIAIFWFLQWRNAAQVIENSPVFYVVEDSMVVTYKGEPDATPSD